MKYFNILIYFGANLIPLAIAAATQYKHQCNIVQNYYNVCKHDDVLQSVRQLPYPNGHAVLDTHLYIKDTSISSIARNAFLRYVPLAFRELSLELGNCQLHLEPGSFNGLELLRTLNIISGIVSLTPNSFESLKSLINLTLSVHPENQYFNKLFSMVQTLNTLRIIDTIFSVINRSTFYKTAPNIKRLDLYRNNISTIESFAFFEFKTLDTLKIVNDHLVNLNSGAFLGLESLRDLEISWQPLEIIRNYTFINLSSLISLKITRNMVNKIETGAFSGLNLYTLDLSNNAIVIIERQSFYSLTIGELILSGNPIFVIYNNAFVHCDAIGRIDLYNTSFTDIDFHKWGIS